MIWVAVSRILSIGAICSDTNLATSCIVFPGNEKLEIIGPGDKPERADLVEFCNPFGDTVIPEIPLGIYLQFNNCRDLSVPCQFPVDDRANIF